jgi:hypothetical protein
MTRWIGNLLLFAGLGLALGLLSVAQAAEPAHAYVGAEKCKMCHNSPAKGAQFAKWTESEHAKAFAVLASDPAKAIAKAKGIADPQTSDECLRCHVTGHGAPAAKLTDKYKKEEGVTCESCHGPGGDYWKMDVMKDRARATAAGMVLPTEATCKTCHNAESPLRSRLARTSKRRCVMTVRVGINGFGRIGRLFLRAAKSRGKDFDFVAINDLSDVKQMALLLRYDSIHGPYPGKVGADGDDLVVDDDRIRTHKVTDKREGDPFQFPWGEVGADVVVESTGIFRRIAELERHLAAGAKKVVLTVPAKDPLEATVVMGVNDGILKPSHRIVSNSSCTTNCAAPVAKVLQELYGIREGFLTTVHAYTNDQRLFDYPHKDARRSRRSMPP